MIESVETHVLAPDRDVPNNSLPLLLYPGGLADPQRDADACQALFARNHWGGTWVDGIFDYWHFHVTGHEVLGCVQGEAEVGFGGDAGIEARSPLVTSSSSRPAWVTSVCRRSAAASPWSALTRRARAARSPAAAKSRLPRPSARSLRSRCRNPIRSAARTARSSRPGVSAEPPVFENTSRTRRHPPVHVRRRRASHSGLNPGAVAEPMRQQSPRPACASVLARLRLC